MHPPRWPTLRRGSQNYYISAGGKIAAILEASIHQYGIIRSRREKKFSAPFCEPLDLLDEMKLDPVQDSFKRFTGGQAPSLNIVPQVRPQILIKPAETAVVMPAQPEHGMANPQKLERFMECAGWKSRDLVKNHGNMLSPTFPRGGGIPGGKC